MVQNLPPFPSFALTEAILFTGETFVEGHALLVKDGHVLDIVAGDKVPAAFVCQSCAGRILAPGFIDCQVNGGGGVTINRAVSAQDVLTVAAAHRKTGVTRFLSTITTDAPEVRQRATAFVREARQADASILGLHWEGPHISLAQKGAHDEAFIRPMNDEDMALYAPRDGEATLVTLAPETVPPEKIALLVSRGLIVSLGHSGAAPALLREGLAAGARGFTHLFNAMGPLSARVPGPAGVALDDRASWCGLIADGRHVAPEMVRLAVHAKPEDKLFLVSDSIDVAGTPEAKLRDPAERLTGAFITLGEIVPRAIRDMNLDPARVLRMASAIPAAFLGVDTALGKLLPGYKADIVAMDMGFRAQEVWRDGARV